MIRPRAVLLSLCLAPSFAAPLVAQTPQFRADVSQTGDASFDGTFYFGDGRMRFEGVADGEEVAGIIDGPANRMIVLMPADQAYMTMDLGSAPFSAPNAAPMDPANPCASGERTECRSLGNETINGRAARGWEYTRDGERETAWIATDLRFPVRTIEADGTTTDLTNVQMGNQPAALFQPPTGWTEMDMSAMLGAFGGGFGGGGAVAGRGVTPTGRGQVPTGATGRGQAAGRGQVPTGGRGQAAGRGAAAPAGGIDPAAIAQLEAQLRGMGLPPDQIAAAIAQMQGSAAVLGTDYSAWEAGEGWIVDLVVTASHEDSGANGDATWTSTLTARFTGSVPMTYGTPGVAGQGPGWGLVPGVSDLGSQRVVFSGTYEYRLTTNFAMRCSERGDGTRLVSVSRANGSTDSNDPSVLQIGAMAQWQLAGDLSTHTLMVGVGAMERTETTDLTTTITGRCPMSDSQGGTEQRTRQPQMTLQVNLEDLPLAASPGVMSGTATTEMGFDLLGGSTNTPVPVTVQWTLRPIS